MIVIGAGAGVEIDMPTGETLNSEIANKVNIGFDVYRKTSGNDTTCEALRQIVRNLKIEPNALFAAGRSIHRGIDYAGSIDNYIYKHRHDENIKICGKIGIVQTIIEYEKKSKLFIDETRGSRRFRDQPGVAKSWLYRLMRILQEGIIVKENIERIFENVTIINFNYDRCVELFLWKALQESHLVPADQAAELISKNLLIVHPYGTVAPLPWQQPHGNVPFGGPSFDGGVDLGALSGNIKTYNEEVEDQPDLELARERISTATRLIFLGFHFHKQNMQLIQPKSPRTSGAVSYAFATTINRSKMDRQIIEGQIGKLMAGRQPEVRCHLNNLDCSGLFTEYGTLFAT